MLTSAITPYGDFLGSLTALLPESWSGPCLIFAASARQIIDLDGDSFNQPRLGKTNSPTGLGSANTLFNSNCVFLGTAEISWKGAAKLIHKWEGWYVNNYELPINNENTDTLSDSGAASYDALHKTSSEEIPKNTARKCARTCSAQKRQMLSLSAIGGSAPTISQSLGFTFERCYSNPAISQEISDLVVQQGSPMTISHIISFPSQDLVYSKTAKKNRQRPQKSILPVSKL